MGRASAKPRGDANADLADWQGHRLSRITDRLCVLGVHAPLGLSQCQSGRHAACRERKFVAVETTAGYEFFSAITGAWTLLRLSQPASVRAADAVALIKQSARVYAYSALTGNVAVRPVASSHEAVTATLGAVVDAKTSRAAVFSALTGGWIDAPAGVRPGLPALASQAALFQVTGGFLAMSARGAVVARIATAASAVAWVDGSSANLVLAEPGKLHIFDARRGTFESATTGTLHTPSLWRTTFVVEDGGRAYAFGAGAGVLEQVAFSGPAIDVRASSECGRVVTATSVFAFSSVSDLMPLAQFPEFRRVRPLGTFVQLQLSSAPLALSVLLVGSARKFATPVPGLGLLWLDPRSIIVGPAGLSDATGLRLSKIHIPGDPRLAGVELFWQGLVLPLGGQPYLTRLAGTHIF